MCRHRTFLGDQSRPSLHVNVFLSQPYRAFNVFCTLRYNVSMQTSIGGIYAGTRIAFCHGKRHQLAEKRARTDECLLISDTKDIYLVDEERHAFPVPNSLSWLGWRHLETVALTLHDGAPKIASKHLCRAM